MIRSSMSPVELAAAIFTLLCVGLCVLRSIWCWPMGAVAVTLYFYVFLKAKLYADMSLQVVYLALQFYGWYQWLYGGENRTELPITRQSTSQLLVLGALGLVGTIGLGTALTVYTDANLPYWDSAATVFSLIAQWMMAKKYLENWLFWIGVNVLYVGLFIRQAMIPSLVLYLILLGMAVMGYREWSKSLRQMEPA